MHRALDRIFSRGIAAAALLVLPLVALCQDVSRKNEQLRKLEQEIAVIDGQLKNTAKLEKSTGQELVLVKKKVANRRSLVDESNKIIAGLEKEIKEKEAANNRLQARVDTLSAYYRNLIYNTYKNRDQRVWFMYVLAGENPGQGYRRFAYLKNLSNVVNGQAREIKSLQSEIETRKAELESLAQEARALKSDREEEYRKILAEEKKVKEMASQLTRDRKKYTRELSAKKSQAQKLNQEIERLLSREVKKKEEIDYTVSGKFEQNKGNLPWPIRGVVVEEFGVHNHPVYKNIQLPESNGITISATGGSDVRCVFDGVVKQILIMPGYNQCVLVQHGEYFTFYCKLAKTGVKVGQQISAGELIGTTEGTEKTASQFHFQIWKGTAKQNPTLWLRQ
ncbi:MAG: peptidoglycan DD-metalloendopeptidase family protein [Bacteroidales bacterium]|nr:peptidoglycan DD-metalloendopeptidase family protein [Bacteroidales bacterium]